VTSISPPETPRASQDRTTRRDSRTSASRLSGDLADALHHDSAELQREVLLWQRWIRYGAAVVVAVGLYLLGYRDLPSPDAAAVGGSAAIYILFTAFIAWFLKHGSGRELPPQLPTVTVLADNLMLAALVYYSTPPIHFYRLLILGFLALHLSVLYFGARTGVWSAALTLTGYFTISLLLPPHVEGWQPVASMMAFDALLFAGIAAAQIATVGNFRARLRELREYCKRVEIGDLSGTQELETTSRPDDLTLLARSFSDMRSRLIELIGSDPLTNCLNRRALEERLSREWRQARRRNSQMALLAIDVDKFKQINDTFGHPTGDIVLQEISAIMRATARETDAIARIGGDEFVVLLPDTGWQGAMTFAERLRRNVDDHQFGSDPAPDVTVSIGVALARGSDDVSVVDLLEEADRSLYKAKSGGRNRISA
jgi:diguanylate cyclase (GGDEF)-like protein